MDTEIIIIYCICDDYLQVIHHWEDPQCRMSDAKGMTTALVAVLYFGGNFALARRFLNRLGYRDIYRPCLTKVASVVVCIA